MRSTGSPKISAWQLSLITIASRGAVMTVFTPVLMAKGDPKNAWLSAFLAGCGALLVVFISVKLADRFPNQTIIQISKEVLGKWIGGVFGILFIWFFMHISILMMRQFAEILNIALMPETPTQVFIIFATIAVIFSINRGLQAIARLSAITTPVSIFSLVMIMILNAKNFHLEALLPVLENGWHGVIYSGIVPFAWSGDIFVLLMLHPYVQDKRLIKSLCLFSVLVTTLLLMALSVSIIAVFGPEEASQLTLPLFSFVRMIEVAHFFERIEAILVAVWISLFLTKMCIYLYVSIIGIGQFMSFPSVRFLIIPLAVLTMIFSFSYFENLAHLKYYLTPKYFGFFTLVIELVLPSLLLLIAIIRHKEQRTV